MENIHKPQSLKYWIVHTFGGRFEQGGTLYVYPSPVPRWKSYLKWKSQKIYLRYKVIQLTGFSKSLNAYLQLRFYEIFKKNKIEKLSQQARYFQQPSVKTCGINEGKIKVITLGYHIYFVKFY